VSDLVGKIGCGLCVFGGALLVASLFMPWHVTEEQDVTRYDTGWVTFDVVDLVLVVVAVVSIAAALWAVSGRDGSQGVAFLAGIVAWVALVVILVRFSSGAFDTGRVGGGGWTGAAALAAIAIGEVTLALRPERALHSGPMT